MTDTTKPSGKNGRPPPIDYFTTHDRANDALREAGGLDAVMHSLLVGLAALNGGRPPKEAQAMRDAIRRGERVYCTITIGHDTPAIRCLIR